MALLRSLRARTAAPLAALLALGAGCAFIDGLTGGEQRFAFSHDIHVVGEELACVSCHENFAVSDEPGMPSPDTCQSCHEEIDADKPAERQVATLFDGEAFKAARVSRLDDELVFSHKLHAKDPKSCNSCHVDIDTNRAIDEEIAVPMARCVDCHAEREVANECSTCHVEIREDVAPRSHQSDWMRFHGRCVRNKSLATADQCELCHTEATCVGCHKDEAPESHTNYFRLRGHGMLAQMDRQSCAVCHTPDTCTSCHEDVLPLTHTGMWGSPLNTHCLSCHFPLRSESCFVCHKSTPSHSLGSPKPDWHTPAMNCRQCHGVSTPLPHVDNGSDCNACHP
jgi:hypothetical protein